MIFRSDPTGTAVIVRTKWRTVDGVDCGTTEPWIVLRRRDGEDEDAFSERVEARVGELDRSGDDHQYDWGYAAEE